MSSLRNAVKRVTHKERSQPRSRQHLGILEKKKDYRERSRDYHRKEDAILALREKAASRNPDEFYFGMHNAEIRDKVHRKTEMARTKEFEAAIGADTVRLMKNQDLGYIRMQKQKDSKKIERLQSSLHLLENDSVGNPAALTTSGMKRKHTIFVESHDELISFDAAEHFGTLPELVGRAFNRPRIAELKKVALRGDGASPGEYSDDEGRDEPCRLLSEEELALMRKSAKKQARILSKARATSYGELIARKKRVAKLARAESHLVTEKLVSQTGTKRMIAPAANGQPAQYKWRQKRLK